MRSLARPPRLLNYYTRKPIPPPQTIQAIRRLPKLLREQRSAFKNGTLCAIPSKPSGVGGCSQAVLLSTHRAGEAITKRGRCRSEERRVGKECRSRWSPY